MDARFYSLDTLLKMHAAAVAKKHPLVAARILTLSVRIAREENQ